MNGLPKQPCSGTGVTPSFGCLQIFTSHFVFLKLTTVVKMIKPR